MAKKASKKTKTKAPAEESIIDKLKGEAKKHIPTGEIEKAFDVLTAYLGKDNKHAKKLKEKRKQVEKLAKSIETSVREFETQGKEISKQIEKMFDQKKK